jgi:hypothetical protein
MIIFFIISYQYLDYIVKFIYAMVITMILIADNFDLVSNYDD